MEFHAHETPKYSRFARLVRQICPNNAVSDEFPPGFAILEWFDSHSRWANQCHQWQLQEPPHPWDPPEEDEEDLPTPEGAKVENVRVSLDEPQCGHFAFFQSAERVINSPSRSHFSQ